MPTSAEDLVRADVARAGLTATPEQVDALVRSRTELRERLDRIAAWIADAPLPVTFDVEEAFRGDAE